jgi:hypothetical protein
MGQNTRCPVFCGAKGRWRPALGAEIADGRAENTARGGVFAAKFGNIYQKIHIEKKKNWAYRQWCPDAPPRPVKMLYIYRK